MDMTKVYNVEDINDALIIDTLKQVYDILKNRGYNPLNQMVGYLMSGDPGYITSYQGARKLILNLERSKVLEVLLRENIK